MASLTKKEAREKFANKMRDYDAVNQRLRTLPDSDEDKVRILQERDAKLAEALQFKTDHNLHISPGEARQMAVKMDSEWEKAEKVYNELPADLQAQITTKRAAAAQEIADFKAYHEVPTSRK